MLPKNSEKYVKTIIAFANTQGGKVIIGVADESREIVGVDNATLFQQMDQISNVVSDSCQPQIVPDIEPYTIDGKTVIIITVSPAPHRPYYLKSKGKEKGTYIRIGGTTRCASSEKIKELEMEGSRISWDELPCVGFPVTEKAIKKLCQDINRYRKEIRTENSTETGINTEILTETEISDRILQLIESEPTITLSKLANSIKTTVGRIRGALDKLRENGVVQHEGAQKNGRWVILTNQSTDSAKGKKRRL